MGSDKSFFSTILGLAPRLYASACFAGSEHRSQVLEEVDQRGGNEDTEQRQRQQDLPAKTHQLIKTKARQRSAQPNVNKEKDANLHQKSDRAHESEKERAARQNQVDERHVPAPEEQRGGQHRDREHVDVFGQEEERKLHRAVFRVKTGDEFGFGFGQIERNAIRLGNRGDQVNDETERVEKYVPTRAVPGGLVLDDLSEIECAGEHDDADQAQAERELVRNHLGRRTQTAHQAVLVV